MAIYTSKSIYFILLSKRKCINRYMNFENNIKFQVINILLCTMYMNKYIV